MSAAAVCAGRRLLISEVYDRVQPFNAGGITMPVNRQEIIQTIPQTRRWMLRRPSQCDVAVSKDNAICHHTDSGNPGVVDVADEGEPAWEQSTTAMYASASWTTPVIPALCSHIFVDT